MELVHEHYEFGIWVKTILWTAFLLIVFKFSKAPKFNKGFKWKHFVNDNSYDLVLNICISIILLRTGDKFIHWLYGVFNKTLLNSFTFKLDADSTDVVMTISLITLPISYVIHKFWRKPISKKVEQEMHVHNDNCKH